MPHSDPEPQPHPDIGVREVHEIGNRTYLVADVEPLDVTGLRSLGRGVAYALKSPALAAMRRHLALEWNDWLKPQDRQNHNPHVTVQNKVDPTQARALLEDLSESFQPFLARGEGLDLWWYRGGPWEMVRTCGFEAPSSLSRVGEGLG